MTRSRPVPTSKKNGSAALMDPEIPISEQLAEGQMIPPDNVPEDRKEEYWLNLVNDPAALRTAVAGLSFWKTLEVLPATLWEDKLIIYAYRLEPAVRNEGKGSYMEKICKPVDEDYFRQRHGGGKYQLLLNCYTEVSGDKRNERIKEIRFSVDGPAKLQPGVIMVDAQGNPLPPPNSTAAAAEPITGDITATVVAAVTEASRANQEMLTEGLKSTLQLKDDLMRKQLGLDGQDSKSQTLADRFMMMVLERGLNPPAPARDPIIEALLTASLKRLTAEPNPQPPPAAAGDLSSQLGLVKEMFDVESLKDLGEIISTKKSHAAAPWWAAPLTEFVGKLPSMIAQVSEMQEKNFRRAVAMRGQGAPQPVNPAITPGAPAPGAPGAPVPQFIPPQPAVHIPGASGTAEVAPPVIEHEPPSARAMIEQQVPQMVNLICQSFDGQRFDGYDTAVHVDMSFPNLLATLYPMLTDPPTLRSFIQGTPLLAARAAAPGWGEFEADFVRYVAEAYGDEEGEPAQGANGDSAKVIAIPIVEPGNA